MPRLFLFSFVSLTLLRAADDPRVKIDNEFVRVIAAEEAPGNRTALHKHEPNRVMVYLSDGHQKVTYQSGRVEDHQWREGSVAWSPGGEMHTSENVGSSTLRIVEIELKKPAPAAAPHRDPALDPVAIDATHNILLFENAQVRVFRSWREPGGTETMHEHAGRGSIAVLLAPMESSTKQADGTEVKTKGAAGDVSWRPGTLRHASTNIGARKIDMIVIELL